MAGSVAPTSLIVTRILRLPGYGVYAWNAETTTGTLTLWIRQTAREPYYVCAGCGISVRDIHSWTERRVRDLPWGTWQVWLVVEMHRIRLPLLQETRRISEVGAGRGAGKNGMASP